MTDLEKKDYTIFTLDFDNYMDNQYWAGAFCDSKEDFIEILKVNGFITDFIEIKQIENRFFVDTIFKNED
jgi:ribosomal protein S8